MKLFDLILSVSFLTLTFVSSAYAVEVMVQINQVIK